LFGNRVPAATRLGFRLPNGRSDPHPVMGRAGLRNLSSG